MCKQRALQCPPRCPDKSRSAGRRRSTGWCAWYTARLAWWTGPSTDGWGRRDRRATRPLTVHGHTATRSTSVARRRRKGKKYVLLHVHTRFPRSPAEHVFGLFFFSMSPVLQVVTGKQCSRIVRNLLVVREIGRKTDVYYTGIRGRFPSERGRRRTLNATVWSPGSFSNRFVFYHLSASVRSDKNILQRPPILSAAASPRSGSARCVPLILRRERFYYHDEKMFVVLTRVIFLFE